MKLFNDLSEYLKILPKGEATDEYTEGAIVLEGGAFRGLYTSGVLDALMQHGINFKTVIGVSAGALNGINYASGQIGRSAVINLAHRNDPEYMGLDALRQTRGLISLDYLLGDLEGVDKLNEDKIKDRRLVMVATSLDSGEAEYFENSNMDIKLATKASASLPYLNRPVEIDGKKYLDGGCADRIPFKWAMKEGYKKIVVIRTRDDNYRYKDNFSRRYLISKRFFSSYPEFAKNLAKTDLDYNVLCDELLEYQKDNKLFIISPSKPIEIGMLEKDVENLSNVYFLGYYDGIMILPKLIEYLKNDD